MSPAALIVDDNEPLLERLRSLVGQTLPLVQTEARANPRAVWAIRAHSDTT